MISLSKENFLKRIYSNEEKGLEFTSPSFMADALRVSNAAITDMARKLAVDGLVLHQLYKGISLTDTGRQEALKVIRRHRLWESFLMNTLKLDWSEVHIEAENLEHHSSDDLIDKIDEYLGFPAFDPHGAPIPDSFGKMPVIRDLMKLSDISVSGDYIVARVLDEDSLALDHLGRIGIFPGIVIKILEKIEIDNGIVILLQNKETTISEVIAKNILIESINLKS
jgi:DtxR family transcriptional regulator, Mn-dependent transcriptional regulator